MKLSPKPTFRLGHERHLWVLSLFAGLPGVGLSLWFLWRGQFSIQAKLTVGLLVFGCWLGVSSSLYFRAMRPLQTLANLLAALREGDYSFRARGARPGDALGEVLIEVNTLSETLQEQRLGAIEATALLRTVMAEIDVAVFAFDGERRIRIVNNAGERLIGENEESLVGKSAESVGLADCLEGDANRTLFFHFPGGNGRFEMRRGVFHEHGIPHQLVFLSDLTRALREEERVAWQRLIRVLGHELNNSLAPISSLAGSLNSLLSRSPRPGDWEEDMTSGLAVISNRAEALSRFMSAYSRLARLPAPNLKPVVVRDLVRHVASLETRLPVAVHTGPDLTIQGDRDQLEQLLINLVKNGVEALNGTGGGVAVEWDVAQFMLEIRVLDDGPGISNTTNLFVPFFTTKPTGSGIGLVLCRQIAEAHGGSLTLENRSDAGGCVARLKLPL